MSPESAARLVRRWVRVYTDGLPDQVRDERREEIESDLWSQLADPIRPSSADRSVAAEILIRLVAGMSADLSWRSQQVDLKRQELLVTFAPPPGLLIGAVLAVTGGSMWIGWPFLVAIFQLNWSQGDVTTMVLTFALMLSTLALAGSLVLTVLTLQDRIRPVAASLGAISASLGAIGVLGAYPAFAALALGSAIVSWELRNLGLVSARVKWAQIVTSIMWAIPIAALTLGLVPFTSLAWTFLMASFPLYGVSWIGLGLALRRANSAQEPGAAPH